MPEILTNTDSVEDLLWSSSPATLWAATRGGIEEYSGTPLHRVRLYTTADGLPTPSVHALTLLDDRLMARTDRASCALDPATSRFTCTAVTPLPAPEPSRAPRFQGYRVTDRITIADGTTFVATAGAGVWIDSPTPVRLTPTDELCANHITSVADFQGQTWFGAFDGGLCAYDGSHFTRLPTPFRLVNDLLPTPIGLYVAASEGLFLTADGRAFTRVDTVDEHGVNDLAFDGQNLYATTPAALYRVRVPGLGGKRNHKWFRPGGARSLQAVDVGPRGAVWIATEDSGALLLRGDDFTIYDKAAGLPSSWALDVAALPDGGALVATLRDGLVHVSPDGTSSPIPGLPDAWMLHVSAAGGGWLVGTQNGAARLDTRLNVVETYRGLPDANAHVLARAGGFLWIATEAGVLRLPGAGAGAGPTGS